MFRILRSSMDKKDIMYGIAAVVIILIMALVVKPMMTGHPVNTGIPVPVTTTVIQNQTVTPITPFPTRVVTTRTPAPTPAPTWNNTVQNVSFVNSSTYGVSLTQEIPNGTRFDNQPLNTSMTSYAKINGQFSGTTQVINIPFPYWELVYTVEPVAETKPSSVQVTSTKGVAAGSGVSGSYSGVTPVFTIQVMDAEDPNRIVRTISPPGGIDINLWKGIKGSVNPASTLKKGQLASNSADTPIVDPRPWTEKFFEGQRSYYFIINAQMLTSYSIDIRVPTRYIGTV
jgi:hypothetical protein